MSPTCRQHVADIAKCRQILADIACRCDTEESPTHPIFLNYSRQVQVSPNVQVPYHRVFVFELKQQSRNCRHVGNSPICRQMSCRLDTLADTTFSCVCDMTETCRRHVADTTQNVAVCRLGKKTTRRHPTYGAKGIVSRDAINSTLTAYNNNNSCAKMRSEARDSYIRIIANEL